jgi:hypothetical protein
LKLSADIQTEKENYDQLKQVMSEMANQKQQMEAKLASINEVIFF